MKVIAIAFQEERLIIDGVDAVTASMTASVLNNLRAQEFHDWYRHPPRKWWFYSAQPDSYEVKHAA